MKLLTTVFLSLFSIFAVQAIPAVSRTSQSKNSPVEYGLVESIDTDDFGSPFGNPFEGVFESFAGIMNRMRQQMDFLLKHLHSSSNSSEGTLSPFPSLPEFDLGKGNTTSVTKIIDGHKVVINETDYKQEGDFGGAFFKVRVIDVLPDSSELTTEKNAEEITTGVNLSKEPESVEQSIENEIQKNRESEVFNNIESFDEIDNKNTVDQYEKLRVPPMMSNDNGFQNQWDKIEPLESFEENSLDNQRPIDLSRDIFINKMMADAGVPSNPDAEVFSDSEIVNAPPSLTH